MNAHGDLTATCGMDLNAANDGGNSQDGSHDTDRVELQFVLFRVKGPLNCVTSNILAQLK